MLNEGQTASVLVVDDDVDICRNMSDILSDLGYDVEVAHDGNSALERVRQRSFDIALLDLKMPGMDGLTLYGEIKKMRAGMVAILVSAYATGRTLDDAMATGVWQVVPKPVEFRRLMTFVEEALGQPLVLIVDDDRELCDTLWDLLREQGYRVCLAHDVSEATQRLRDTTYQAVLIDVRLPDGDGGQVYQQVKQTNPQARTIVITGHSPDAEPKVIALLAEGTDAVHYKPFDIPKLLATLEQVV
ncbi:MAG: response regulator [Isosphaeraceae bacterium]|nr:response regulator [Isosphaeraceae bacterium]